MTDVNEQPTHAYEERPWRDDVIAMVRARADGELSAAEERALEKRLAESGKGAEADAQSYFERGLREAVGRVMTSQNGGAPEGLRERIQSALREAPGHEFESETPISFELTRRVAPWGLMAAAAIALSVGAALMLRGGGVGLPISGGAASPMGSAGNQSDAEITQYASIISTEQSTQLVSFISGQHTTCEVYGENFNRKMHARTEAEAAEAAIELLSRVPSVLELGSEELESSGYRFAGLGRCRVPGVGRSAHLMYTSTLVGAPAVSLFIQEDTGEMSLNDDRFYACDQLEKTGKTLSVWKKDGLIYYLFTTQPEQAPAARMAFGAPSLRGKLS